MVARIPGWIYIAALGGYVPDTTYFPGLGTYDDPSYRTNPDWEKYYFYYDGHYYSRGTVKVEYITQPGVRYTVSRRKPLQELLDVATDIEIAVFNWLANRGIPFEFQSQLVGEGIRDTGDARADFFLPEHSTVLRCQGLYWHEGAEVEGKDIIQKELLRQKGYTVVDLAEADIHERLDVVMEKAIVGEELPK